MFHFLAAGTHLYRVTAIGRTWQDVVSGVGSYFTSGGRYNRVQQRTVYAAIDPVVALAESAVYVATDDWLRRIRPGLFDRKHLQFLLSQPGRDHHARRC